MKTYWFEGFLGRWQEGEILAYTESFFTGTKAVIKVTKSDKNIHKIGSLVSVPICNLYFTSTE